MTTACRVGFDRKEKHMSAKSIATVLVFILLAGMVGCSGIKVSTDYNREFDFSRFKTYEWMAGEPDVLRDPLIDTALLDRRVKQAADRELSERGYVKSESDPDFYVSYHFGTESQVDVSSCGYHYPVSPRCWGREVETYTYTKGTLILDIVEPDDLELVWRGYATEAIYGVERMDETIDEAVTKVLAKFPPGT
jgi:hypothetical protein